MTHRAILPVLAALFLIACAAARADEPKAPALPAPAAGPATLFTYGKENPDCQEWTNACQICSRDDKGAPQCSTAGIACVPGAMVCRVNKAK